MIHTKERDIPTVSSVGLHSIDALSDINKASFAVSYETPNAFWNAIAMCNYMPRSRQLFKPMTQETNRLRSFESEWGFAEYGGHGHGFGGGGGGGGGAGGSD